jgi:molybdate transport system substrate-binding protein
MRLSREVLMKQIRFLSAGAAQSLVSQSQQRFLAQSGYAVDGDFGAVGLIKDRLLAGEPCDLIILSEALIGQLAASGHVVAGSAQALGSVKTGIAVKAADLAPQVDNPTKLRAALLAAAEIYLPDPVKATAGVHFMNVLTQLGIDKEVFARLRPFPNGAIAMRELAQTGEPGAIGCTQMTEIIFTPGVKVVAALPKEFELATIYTAGVFTRAAQPGAAAEFIQLLCGSDAAPLRRASGFEFA